jgi:hypothetical protein
MLKLALDFPIGCLCMDSEWLTDKTLGTNWCAHVGKGFTKEDMKRAQKEFSICPRAIQAGLCRKGVRRKWRHAPQWGLSRADEFSLHFLSQLYPRCVHGEDFCSPLRHVSRAFAHPRLWRLPPFAPSSPIFVPNTRLFSLTRLSRCLGSPSPPRPLSPPLPVPFGPLLLAGAPHLRLAHGRHARRRDRQPLRARRRCCRPRPVPRSGSPLRLRVFKTRILPRRRGRIRLPRVL